MNCCEEIVIRRTALGAGDIDHRKSWQAYWDVVKSLRENPDWNLLWSLRASVRSEHERGWYLL